AICSSLHSGPTPYCSRSLSSSGIIFSRGGRTPPSQNKRKPGDSYDNAMAESINGLYKAEVIHRKSWKNRAEVELATLTWVDW
ncbi:integrase core domain-containing protein, partial [Escherichia coli]